MENLERNIKSPNIEENSHKARCIECPEYNECIGIWLYYFSGKNIVNK
jgi:hypothetical protein